MKHLLAAILPIFFILQLVGQSSQIASAPVRSDEVFFDFGKHDLRPEADSLLMSIIDFCQGMESFEIKITAHTDSIGTLKNNEALSQRRAGAVAAFLEKNGIAGKAIRTAVFGEKKPAAGNSTEQGRQLNRRATIEVWSVIPMAVIEGTVVNEKTGEPVAADVILHTKDSRDTLRTNAAGHFKKEFPIGAIVGIDAFAECYFMKSEMVKVLQENKPVKLELKPATAGESADIENLYFVGNDSMLLEKSKPELPKILRFMQLSPKMKIEIAGHVNVPNSPPVVEESREYKLSVARARMVHDYLLANNISPDRISYKGYGNWKMRFPRALSQEQQALNRRVEIRVLEGGCP